MENKEDKGKLQMALNFEEREREGGNPAGSRAR
jgi:hypothetical protein